MLTHRALFQNSLIDEVKGIIRETGEIDLRFLLRLNITLAESTYPNQHPQCPFLSRYFLLVTCTYAVDLTQQIKQKRIILAFHQ